MRCRQFMFGVALCLCGLASPGAPVAGWADYNSRLWQMEDGLPHNIVQAITQTRDGYLWIGTREGLARFDGDAFQTIEVMPENPRLSVTALLESKDGSLWIGTDASGLFRLRDGRVERHQDPGGKLDFNVQDICEAGDGGIWIASLQTIFRWADGNMEAKAEFRSRFQTLCVDLTGAVWTAGDSVLRQLDDGGTNAARPGISLPVSVRRLICDKDGIFWAGAGNGLAQVENGEPKLFKKADGPSGFVSAILRDSAGGLWIGSYSGISRFVAGQFVSQGEADAPAYRVYALYEDNERNLWVGSEEGLTRITTRVFKTITKRDGLTLNTVATVCADPDGGVWISAWGGGLDHWADGKITSLNKSNGLSSNFIMAMCTGRDGSLWAGADYGGALNRITDGAITIYGLEQGFIARPTTATTAMHEDQQGVLWIGSRELLQRWDGTNFSFFTTTNGLSHQKINAICGGADGTLWIGTEGGLTRGWEGEFADLGKMDPRLKTLILSLYEDAEGVLWIGTRRDGLLRWKNGVLNQFTSSEGLFSDAIYSILEDRHTNLWLNSSRGIFRVEKKQIEAFMRGERGMVNSVIYGRADGVLSSGQYGEVTQPTACQDMAGRLWFRTTQGVAVVNPDQINANDLPPPVVIQAIIADRHPVGNSPLSFAPPREVTVRPGRGELEIRYAALSFRAPEKNQFRYKLEGAGVDPDWVEATTRRVAFYNNLRPGRYRFQVVACNNDGVWNETGAAVMLVLQPHFWQTRWFLVLTILGAAGGVGGTVRYVTRRRMQRKLERLEQQHALEKERTRIARDIHDELGAKLTRISFQGDTARRGANPPETDRHIARMSETARELITSLDQIVWAVDPENDSLENTANYLCRYVSDFSADSPITCKFKIPRQLPDCRLSTDVRHNVFLAVKEAVSNAFKHSGATQIVLSISIRENEFEISLTDNGRGITAPPDAPARTRRKGRGLPGMAERMASIHGKFAVEIEPDAGTTIRFVIPLPEAAGRPSYVHPNRNPHS
jgi:ligand-binding sensor domain-containing protein/anti-sigma regulatory factor (Ser/Thr protein kinase)